MNGAPGSAWASAVLGDDGDRHVRFLGTPAHDDPTPLRADHLFDLASLTKAFTATAALVLFDRGVVDLDAPVRSLVEVGRGDGATAITLRHLMTHTSGLPAVCDAWRGGLRGEALVDAALTSPLRARPGTAHEYSDVGFIAAGRVLEAAAGRSLDAILREHVADPLGAVSLTYRPARSSSVATETQPHRGAIRGEVHDELAHALGTPTGHAGLFGTLDDVVALASMVSAEGEGPAGTVLTPASVGLLTRGSATASGYAQAIGLRVHDVTWMGRADAVGHTGFTGTCFAVAPRTGRVAVLLTNRVHPTRVDTDITAVRRRFIEGALGAAEG